MYESVNILVSIIAVVFAVTLSLRILHKRAGSEQMQEVSKTIRRGAIVFLKKEYEVVLVFVSIVFALLSYFINAQIALCFLAGALLSGTSGILSMMVATKANVRVAEGAKRSIREALDIAFSSSTVMSLSIVGMGLFGITSLYLVFKDPEILFGFALGASSIALFSRVGGGIFTKTADVAADIVGKVESSIREDDPRNPATIADNVGDNVGDIAGLGADLFESYSGSIIAAMSIAVLIMDQRLISLPLMIATIGVSISVIVLYFSRRFKDYHKRLTETYLYGNVLVIFGILFFTYYFLPESFLFENITISRFGIFASSTVGILAGIMISAITKKYTYTEDKAVQNLAKSCESGAATNIIEGFALGLRSTTLSVLTIIIAILVSYYFASIFGVAIADVSLLCTLSIALAIDAFGPVADNAQGIAEMTHMSKKVLKRTSTLDSIGNTTAAIGKGYAVASSAFTSIALFASYVAISGLSVIDIRNPVVLIGIFVGGMIAFLFSSMTLSAVGKAADKLIQEIRRQFKVLHVLEGKNKPDYNKCISIATSSALAEMMLPGLMAIGTPIVLGILFGPAAVGGLLAGALVTSVLLAITMFNAGAAWDNAKKVIEDKGIKGEMHAAAVIGDTVGDPMKDTAGPSLNILIKLISIVSLIVLPFFLKYGPLIKF